MQEGDGGEEMPALPEARAQEAARRAHGLFRARLLRAGPRVTRAQPRAPCPSYARPETWDTPQLPREGTTCSLGGLLEDLSIISCGFCHLASWMLHIQRAGGKTLYTCRNLPRVFKYLYFFLFLIYKYIHIRSS